MLAYQILASTTRGKLQKKLYKKIDLKYQLQRLIINLNLLMHHPVRIFVDKIENSITFKIKIG